MNFFIIISLSLFLNVSISALPQKDYTEVNSLNTFQQVINSNKPTVLLFYAPWCNACTAIKPIFAHEARLYKNKAQFIAIDVTKEHLKDPIDMFGIQGIPTLCYKEVGFKNKEQFHKLISTFLGKIEKQKPITKTSKKNLKKSKPQKIVKKPTGKQRHPINKKKNNHLLYL